MVPFVIMLQNLSWTRHFGHYGRDTIQDNDVGATTSERCNFDVMRQMFLKSNF